MLVKARNNQGRVGDQGLAGSARSSLPWNCEPYGELVRTCMNVATAARLAVLTAH
jgi:hypothetical protein